MPLTEGRQPDVIPSEVDPDYECVRLGSSTSEGMPATPPPGGGGGGPGGSTLCPEGYVPRRRRRPYRADGKRVVREGPPDRRSKPSD